MKTGKKQYRKSESFIANLEPLEGRQLMSVSPILLHPPTVAFVPTFTVTNTNSAGTGSFAQAIQNADSSPFGSVNINFAISGTNPIIPVNGTLPALTHSNVTIDGTTQAGGSVGLNGSVGGIMGLELSGASGCTIKGFGIANFKSSQYATAIGVYDGSNNNFSNVTINNCGIGILFDSASDGNHVSSSRIQGSLFDGICITGSGNTIGVQEPVGPYAGVVVSGSKGNGIELLGANNSIIGTQVDTCAKDCIVFDSGAASNSVSDSIVDQFSGALPWLLHRYTGRRLLQPSRPCIRLSHESHQLLGQRCNHRVVRDQRTGHRQHG